MVREVSEVAPSAVYQPSTKSAAVDTSVATGIKKATNDVKPSEPAELELSLDLEVIKRAAETVSSFIQTVSRDVRMSFDETLNRPVMTVTDSKTNELIRQIPSEDLVAIARFLEAQGSDPVKNEAIAGILFADQS